MSNQKVSLNGFENVFEGIINEVFEDAEQEVINVVRETTKATVDSLKKDFPEGAGVYHSWDDYASGWRYKTKQDAYGGVKATIYNKDKYMLTHLLENGHLNQDGTMSKKFPHIEPAAEEAFKEIERKLKDGI